MYNVLLGGRQNQIWLFANKFKTTQKQFVNVTLINN